MKMSNKTYDVLVWVAQIVLPALATLYGALAGIWGFPYGEQIVSTIAAVDVFLGAVLKISNAQYRKTSAAEGVE
jgi:hypothetical protein